LLGGREHKIEGVGAETFVRLLRFAYGNGLYDSLKSPLENQAFLAMLDTLQITAFGRNHVRNPRACVCGVCAVFVRCVLTRSAHAVQRLVGTGMIIKRTDAMLRDDFIRLFRTANRISIAPTTTAPASTCDADEPPPSSSAPAPQGTAKRRGRKKWETLAERERRVFAEVQARRAADAQAQRDKAQREARAASGLPGTLLNEAFLRRHGWFADLRVGCASDVSGRGGQESQEDEEEAEVKESETGHGAFVCHKFLLCVRSPYFQGIGVSCACGVCCRVCRVCRVCCRWLRG
jgi:hypothetical protein